MNPFAEVGVAVVGSAMVDQITYCERIPDDGETLRADRYVQGFGGKGANQAVMAARLGAAVSFIGCVGGDALGTATIANLRGDGINTDGVAVVAGDASGVAPIWVDRHGRNRILIAAGANDRLDAAHVVDSLGRLATVPAVTVAQLETPQAATAAAFEWARGHGAITVLNPAPAAPIDAAVLAVTDWLVPNESEYVALFGGALDPHSVAETARRGGHGLVVTLGAAGALVAESTSPGDAAAVSAEPVDRVVDSTGAGDAFVGAFCVGLAAGLSALGASRLGCAAGTLSVTAAGTQTSFPDAAAVLAPHGGDVATALR